MVALSFGLYGLGMAPAYYAWGFLAPEVIAELGLTRAQIGNTFGLFALTFAATSPVAALAIQRCGLRPVVAVGAVIGAGGFAWTSLAQSANELLLSYALTGGVGIGLTTLMPAQLLPIRWFRRYRARATGLILLGAAVVGAFVPAGADALLVSHDWRFVWQVVAVVTLTVGVLAALLLRERPEDLGQSPDGEPRAPSVASGAVATAAVVSESGPSTREALLSRQFLWVTFACLANAVPWRVITAHGRLHFEDLAFSSSVAAAVLGLRVGLSGAGRLAGSAGDFLDPRYVLALALLVTSVGLTGLATTTSISAAYASIALLGVGYGVAFTSEPIVVARVLGTRAFVGSNGVRLALIGVVGWLAPRWAGAAADATGSYTTSFLALSALGVVGAIAVFFCRPWSGGEGVGRLTRSRP